MENKMIGRGPATHHYRAVLFIPNHFTEARVMIAMLLATDQEIEVLPSPDPPCERCLGSSASAVVQLVLDDLRDDGRSGTERFARLPDCVGPHVVLGAI